MNRKTYQTTRRMIRDNGRYALNWMTPELRAQWDHLLFNIQDTNDWLSERADIVAWCNREGVACNPRQTGRMPA